MNMIFRRVLLFALLMAPFPFRENHASAADPPHRPNIVFIMADDLGWAELGCYGQKKIRTPHIDRLAAEGMRFTQHYSGAPVCAPARCVLMTGKHLGHAYIRNNSEVKPEGQRPIPSEERTVAELLKEQGYATAAIGKWGLGPVGSSGDPNRQGFDLFFGYNCQRHAHSYYPTYLWKNDTRVPVDNPKVPVYAKLPKGADPNDPANYEKYQGKTYSPDLMIEEALGFIRENKDRPFFLYYPTTVPHLGIQVPDDSLAEYKGLWDDPPYPGGHGYVPHHSPRAAYAAMVTRMDAHVGRIMKLLKDLNLDENTIVFFTSDNGPTYDRLGGSDSEFFESAAHFRGLKGSVYEGGIRVPMIARWPGKIAPGTKTNHLSAFYDVLPTLAEVAGADAGTNIDGISFLPTLLGQDDQKPHEFLLWEFYGYGGQQAARLGKWKGVRRNCRRNSEGPIELYDLEADPSEKNDVAEEHPEIVKRIGKIMREEHAESELWRFGKK